MTTKSIGTNLATSDTATKLAVLRLASSGSVKQADCVTYITRQILELDLKRGISPSLSPKRIGLAERITNCCEELFAANLLVAVNEQEFTLTSLGREMLNSNPQGVIEDAFNSLPDSSRNLRQVAGSKSIPTNRNSHYDEGFSAYRDGEDYTDNPYPNDRAEHLAWYNGWAEALDHEQEHGPLFNMSGS